MMLIGTGDTSRNSGLALENSPRGYEDLRFDVWK